MQPNNFDVIILGAGLSGSSLASIIAKNGFKVLLLERGSHPRFTIGESMLPQTSLWLWMIGERFGVPEIKHLSDTKTVFKHVSVNCGIKKSIAFAYHERGEAQDPNKIHQLVPPHTSLISESHIFRQDIDLYMINVATSYGAEYHDLVEVQDIDFLEDEVKVKTTSGEEFRGKFLIDGSGYDSPVVKKFQLREQPTHLKSNSRAIFTHVTGLQSYDDLLGKNAPNLTHQLHEGTLHHVFDGGWFWIIPFNNHHNSQNPLCSVGLMLDGKKYPKTQSNPEQEFQQITAQFPSIAKHLSEIQPAQNWKAIDRVQYSCKSAIGWRYALLNHSYGFVDPLYSRGIVNSLEVINALASQLLPALKENNFAIERFAPLDKLQAALVDETDKINYNSYRSTSSFSLWNPWCQIWLATKIFGDTYLFRSCLKYLETSNLSYLEKHSSSLPALADAPFAQDIQALVNGYHYLLDRVDAKELSPEEAGEQMLKLLRNTDWLPKSVYAWGQSETRHADFVHQMASWIDWGKTNAPLKLQQELFDFKYPQLV
jgi:FADH2 O2-dependent halogenase